MKLSRDVWIILGLLLLIPLMVVSGLAGLAAGHYFAEGYENDVNWIAFWVVLISMVFVSSFVITKVITWGDKEHFKNLKIYREKIKEEKLKDAALNFYSKISDCRTENELIDRLEDLGFKKMEKK